MQGKVIRTGNSLAFIFPRMWSKVHKLKPNDPLKVTINDDTLKIKPMNGGHNKKEVS